MTSLVIHIVLRHWPRSPASISVKESSPDHLVFVLVLLFAAAALALATATARHARRVA